MTSARRALAVLVMAVVVLPLTGLSARPAAADTLITAVSLDSLGNDGSNAQPGVSLAKEPAYTLVPTTSGTTTTFRPRNSDGFLVISPYVALTPADGAAQLTTGTWPTATTAGPGVAGLVVNGRVCPSVGSLTVHDVAYSAGALSSLSATYSYRCSAEAGVAYGELRYRSTEGIAVLATPTAMFLGSSPVGKPTLTTMLTVRNSGTLPVAVGTASLSGESPEEFAVVSDGCAGTTVAAGDSCSIGLQATPSVLNDRHAVLTVPDGTARGARVIALTTRGFTTPSAPARLGAVAASDGIAVDWSQPADSGGDYVSAYQVFRGSSADDLSLIATVEAATHYSDRLSDSTLPGTAYTYAVRAVNGAGSGALSPASQATTPAQALVPTATQRVVVEPGQGVTETGATQVLDAAQGATFFRTGNAFGQFRAGAYVPYKAGTNVTLTPPLGGTFASGTYDVLGMPDATHAGAYVDSSNGSCYISSGALTVHTVALDADNTPSVVSYELTYRCSSDSAVNRVVLRLGDDTPYTAVDVPDTAAGLVAVGTPTTVHSTFTNVGTQDVSVTDVAVSDATNGTWSVTGGTCLDQAVTPGQSCTADVDVTPTGTGAATALIRFEHTGGSSPTVRALSAVGAAAPLEAASLSVSRSAGKVTLSWSDTGAAHQKATTWEIWRGDAPDALSLLGTTSATSFTDPDTTSSLRYYSVRGHNPGGDGPWHPVTVDASATPLVLGASATAATVILDWQPSASLSADPVTGYRVYRGASADSLVAVGDTTSTRWTGPAPSKGEKAWYAVAPVMGSAVGVLSEPVAVTGSGLQLVTTTEGASNGAVQLRSATDGRALALPGGAYGAFPRDVAVSPNGTRTAYVVEHRDYPGYDVVVRSTDGSGISTVLASDGKRKADLAWSPDGTWLAFTAASDNGTSTVLDVVKAAGGPVSAVINSVGLSAPSWLDSTTIVASDSSSAAAPLVRIGAFSGTGTRTTLAGTGGGTLPSVRPGAAEIAFVVPSGDQDFEQLRVLTVATGAVRAVSSPASSYLSRASWTPDGSALYVVASGATTDVFAVATAAGATARNVTGTPDQVETSVAVSMPDTTAPTAVVLRGIPAVALGTTITPTFSAADALTGVGTYALSYRRAAFNGAFGGPTTVAVTSPHAVPVARGYEYCFSVRAIDRAGNASAATPEQCSVVPLDDRSLARSSAFAPVAGSGYYVGTAMRSMTKGATLTRTGVAGARQLYLVVVTCRTCGSVDVLIGSVRVATVSLVSSATTYRKVIALPAGSPRTGTLTLRVTSTNRQVFIDGVGIRK